MAEGLYDPFQGTVSPRWNRYAVGYGKIEIGKGSLRLGLERGELHRLSDVQIDDYLTLSHKGLLPWRPPLTMEVRARFSHSQEALLGTAGFGFWNAPLAPNHTFLAPPNWVWFYFCSAPSNIAFQPGSPGFGWKASMLHSGTAHPLTLALGRVLLSLPGVSRWAWRLAKVRIVAQEVPLDLELREWHTYRLTWAEEEVRFGVDGSEMGRAARPPRLPLGFVAWMDNNWAGFGPDGTYRGGQLAIPQEQWMELEYVSLAPGGRPGGGKVGGATQP